MVHGVLTIGNDENKIHEMRIHRTCKLLLFHSERLLIMIARRHSESLNPRRITVVWKMSSETA